MTYDDALPPLEFTQEDIDEASRCDKSPFERKSKLRLRQEVASRERQLSAMQRDRDRLQTIINYHYSITGPIDWFGLDRLIGEYIAIREQGETTQTTDRVHDAAARIGWLLADGRQRMIDNQKEKEHGN